MSLTGNAENPFIAASDVIMERGWHQGSRVTEDGRMCIIGALAYVTTHSWFGEVPWEVDLMLGDVVPEGWFRDAMHWNDRPERTEAQVHGLLHDAAMLWKERHAG